MASPAHILVIISGCSHDPGVLAVRRRVGESADQTYTRLLEACLQEGLAPPVFVAARGYGETVFP